MLLLSSASGRAASSTRNGSEDVVTTIHEAKQASGLNGQVGSREGNSRLRSGDLDLVNRRPMEEIARSPRRTGSTSGSCSFPFQTPTIHRFSTHTHPTDALGVRYIVFTSIKLRFSRCPISNRLSLVIPPENCCLLRRQRLGSPYGSRHSIVIQEKLSVETIAETNGSENATR